MALISATISKASQINQRATTSFITRGRRHRPCATRTGRCTTHVLARADRLRLPPSTVQNIKRDPFEQAVGLDQKTAMGLGGALGAPATAFLYDWNMPPIGQQLWLKELQSYETFPPLQAPRVLRPESNH
jgi:hypothetical protein